jgi:hypothetical protein
VVRLRFKKLGEERRGAKGSEAWRRGKRLGWEGKEEGSGYGGCELREGKINCFVSL